MVFEPDSESVILDKIYELDSFWISVKVSHGLVVSWVFQATDSVL